MKFNISQIPITFFIPAYNCSNTIEEAVNSIFLGNFKDSDQLIIVNDASTDQTKNVLEELKKKHPFIQVIDHQTNRGGGAARNTAVKNAKHSILFCLDSDNILASNSVPELQDFMLMHNYDVAAFQEVHFFQKRFDCISHRWIFQAGTITFSDYLATYIVPGASGNYMFTKASWERAKGYPEFASASDTWGFGFRQLATDAQMGTLENSYYYHRYGHDSYWVRESKSSNTSLRLLQIMEPYFDLLNNEDKLYITSKEHCDSWFNNIAKRPIRIKGEESFSTSTAFVADTNYFGKKYKLKEFLKTFLKMRMG